jgi:hypothetical protein
MSAGLCGCGNQRANSREPVPQNTRSTQHPSSKQNLKRISLALRQYHEEYQSFPPAYVLGDNDERWHSWRVLILPFLGDAEQELYSRYRFDEPWNGPHNAKLASSIPDVFASPDTNAKPDTTPYLAVVGRRTMWPGPFCCKLRDVTDGVSNTLQLIENPDSDRNWMEPRDFTHREAQQFFKQRSRAAGDEGAFNIAMGDSRIVLLQPSKADRLRFHGWLTPHGGQPLVSADLLPDEELELPDYDFAKPQDANSAKQTLIMPHLEKKLTPGENQIYCATFQLAWDELRKAYGGDSIALDPPHGTVAHLNRGLFPRTSLAPQCYLAMIGSVEEIQAEMAKRFPQATPNLTPTPALDPGFTCYAYLEKRLPFDEEFDSLDKPILFGSDKEPVNGFGLRPTEKNRATGGAVLESQVEVLDYVNDDDFILRLSSVGPQQDRILLARVQPAETLQQTLDAVLARIEQPHPHHTRHHLETVDTLKIPIVLFNYMRVYDELQGCEIYTEPAPGRRQSTGGTISSARQMIQFRLDETGGLLISDAEIQVIGDFGDPEPPPPPKPRHFIFDQPFLMVLQEKGATTPYLVAWIANAEVMEREGRK